MFVDFLLLKRFRVVGGGLRQECAKKEYERRDKNCKKKLPFTRFNCDAKT